MNIAIDSTQLIASGVATIHPVILSGGAGTRLWPLSRSSHPKQLLRLLSEHSMIQMTAARTQGIAGFGDPVVVCSHEHRFAIEEQLHAIDVSPAQLILEPMGRNTGPAVAAAANWLVERDRDALMLVQPSDHVIASLPAFHRAVACGVPAAMDGHLVTFGVRPTRPETGFGYIAQGEGLDESETVCKVDRFVEKPDRDTAAGYCASGQFLWNSGIFLFSARHFLAELERLNAPMALACSKAHLARKESDGAAALDAEHFAAAPSLSVDRAVLEGTARAAVVPVDMGWNDVGTWPALRDIAAPDEQGNVVQGDVLLSDVRNSYIRSDGKLVAALGVDNLVIVSTDDATLVVAADRAAEVSSVVERLKRSNRPEQAHHTTVQRPWGYYRTTDAGDRFQVKRIVVKPGACLSLQKHYHRAEHWIVVRGTAMVQKGAERVLLGENQSIHIPLGIEHRLENPGRVDLHLIEVQSGTYLGEDDIVRIADSYGRA